MTSPEVREIVLRRDRICFRARSEIVARFGPHSCRDANGPHFCGDQRRLTMEHFWRFPGGIRSKRAVCMDPACLGYKTDDEHCQVALCWAENDANPSEAMREAMRAYLDSIYGPAPAPSWQLP